MGLKLLLKLPRTEYDTRAILRWLWRAWRGNRLQAILNATVGLLGVVVSLAQVTAVKHAIDVASGTMSGNVLRAVGWMAVLVLLDFGLNISSIWIKNILGIKAQNRMQQQIVDRLLRSEWKGKEKRHSGDVLNRLEFDVETVVSFLTETIPSAISILAMFLGAFFYLFSMDHLLAVITVAVFPLFLLVSKIYVRQMRRLNRQVRNYDSKVQSVLQETIQHRALIKTLESDDIMIGRLEHTQGHLRHRVVRRTKFRVFSNLILNTGFTFGYLLAFLWAAIRMSRHTLTFGGMTAFLQLVNRIQGPARDLAKLVPAYVGVYTAAERLMELEDDPMEKQGDPIELDPPCGIRMKGVTFEYDSADGDVIRNLSFDFTPGSSTAILGETGAGKTTLIRLLFAFLHPQEGSIEIYNEEGAQPLTPLHRCNFVYVPQGNTLMSGTIRENLCLGKLNATDEEMKEALRKSCAEFVFDLPDGLATVCSEQGGGLSEGQAQRISIARSLLRNRSIMIFDEATSALDPETEHRLLQNLLSAHDKTILFITHRPAVVAYCDQSLRINKIKEPTH
ncbi:ABC transporter ATP-binding protein [Segatella asaccharophila]|jgi:ABC-type multidrug transport system fused ATPase/permease subunit|nr:ABC transporter ATP-binding protein [uncultured Prevotella sp.]